MNQYSGCQIRVELRVMGDDFSPPEFTRKLGIKPTCEWRKGERLGKNRPPRQYDCWLFSTKFLETRDVNEGLKIIKETFSSKANEIRRIVSLWKLDVCLQLEIKFKADQTPGLTFDLEFLEFINLIGAWIDIDMYVEDSGAVGQESDP